ncbi:hypothetical protein [Bacillus sp. 165]|nr:hypothetical protein [Bacillus sp. 165]
MGKFLHAKTDTVIIEAIGENKEGGSQKEEAIPPAADCFFF